MEPTINRHKRTRAQESSSAIERLYITMRHLFNRGFYKPMGVSGESLRESLLVLSPEIYGSIAEDKTELVGLKYVIDRLPIGIEECRYINLTSNEGYKNSHFTPIVPKKRRRNCYRIDNEQMNIEITRGRSEIYDILTHLTFLFIESQKICKRVLFDENGTTSRDWKKLEEAALNSKKISKKERETAITHAANILGHTFKEVSGLYETFATNKKPERFLEIIYWLGKLAINEVSLNEKRVVSFSKVLRERLGHHIHGEIWANRIKETLVKHNLIHRPIHIISANLHSVMNTLFAPEALVKETNQCVFDTYEALSLKENAKLRDQVEKTALAKGMITIKDTSGTNIDVQIFDTNQIDLKKIDLNISLKAEKHKNPIIFVMDYAFGEQAYETIDELLKPYQSNQKEVFLDVLSISIMGKAGILEGEKGDVMIPSAHVFEGTADNYPFKNELSKSDFENDDLAVYEGAMVTVLGTSLQNKDILKFFL
jgi:hypothetical protein